MKRRDVQLPILNLRADLSRGSAKSDERTVECVFYTGAEVIRYPIFDDPFLLSFSLKPGAARLERLNAGAPVLDSHNRYGGVKQVMGVVERGTAKVGSEGATALLRFSKRPEMDGVWQDVQDEILTNLSMGVVAYEMQEIGKDEATGLRRMLATDWEPQEISLLGVAADFGAGIRLSEAEGDRRPCRVIYTAKGKPSAQGGDMKVKLIVDVEELGKAGEIVEIEETDFDAELHEKLEAAKPKKAKPASSDDDSPDAAARKVDAAIAADKERSDQVLRAAEHYGLDDIWAQKQINARTPIAKVLELAAEERAKRNPTGVNIGEDFESWPHRREQMAAAISARSLGKPVPEKAREFANMGFVDLGYEVLKALRLSHGLDPRNRALVIELALSTSDYPNLLANAGNKVLMPAYEAAFEVFRLLCVRQDVADFKSVSILNVGDFPTPLQVGENGEIKLGYFAEQKNTVALGTYGRRLSFSRQMLINDDLSSFGRVLASYGIRIADYQNAAFFTLLSTVGPTLGDGGAMFNATALTTAGGHANYTSSGTAISDTSITVGAALMAAQTGIGADNLGDGIKLNVQPKFLLAAPGKRSLAFQYTSAAYVPATQTAMSPWAGLLTPILDANLSGNRWWLFADPALFPNFAWGSLIGSPGPRVATRAGFEVEGVEMRVAFDFYVGGIDWRGGYCNAGA